MDLELRETDQGVIMAVKAAPGARKNEIRGVVDGQLKVCVTVVAEKGKANKAIIDFLAKQFKLSKSDLEIVAGHTSSSKKMLLRGRTAQQIRELLKPLV
jgi:uncharacterized protein (TIGR00251 family)